MGKEIERKFLVTSIPDTLQVLSTTAIYQSYLATSDHEEVRLRLSQRPSMPPTYQLALKFGSGLVRAEHEYEISVEIYDQLLSGKLITPLVKVRKVLQDSEGRQYDVDIYDEALSIFMKRKPLIVAEVEFQSVEEANAYQPADWFEQELTGNKQYSNRALFQLLQGFR